MTGSWGRRTRAAAVAVACLLAAAPAAARADQTITSPGPLEALWIGDDLACQVWYDQGGTFEFYPPDTAPGDCGTFLEVGGSLYAPDFDAHSRSVADNMNTTPFTPVSEALTGAGTAADPKAITTEVQAGNLKLSQRVTYVDGASSYRVDMTVRNETADAIEFRLYHAGDCYASGSDIGYGFRRPEIRSVGCSQAPDNAPAGRTIQLLPRSPGSRSYEARYDQIWEWIDSRQDFDNSCRCSESIDNGVGLNWHRIAGGFQTVTLSLEVAFTEATPPAPLVDADGDALPDVWETGALATGDGENLGAMGASTAKRDIFVQADWTPGCKPAGDWIRRAVEMFDQHGIALHVDSGADSLNANLQPWGGLSRAGEVQMQLPILPPNRVGHIDVRSDWSQVDAAKDEYFTPAGRRRAFHYVLFAPLIWFKDEPGPSWGGQSRGAPDADMVIANCVKTPRADVTLFVHELGHNLGLFHGGNEHKQHKANYHSTMNYGWSLWAADDERRFVPYSEGKLPAVDENKISERDGIPAPAFWYCQPKGATELRKNNILGSVGTRLRDWDLDCDGKFSESKIRQDLNADGAFDILGDYNDWTGLRLGGGGIIGSLALPPRVDTPQVPEFTEKDFVTARAQTNAAAAAAGKQLRLVTKTRQVRRPKNRRRANTIKVTVQTLSGKRVRSATVRVKGGKFANGRTKLKTDRRGRITLRVRVSSKKQLELTAQRGGYQKTTLLLPVKRR